MMRIRGSILCGSLVLIVWAGYTQAEIEKEALPIIEVEMPTYDFGRALQGEVVKHEFRVFNRGGAALEIKNVRPSWGCTAARFDRTIPAGGQGKIILELRTEGRQGNFGKSALVVTNDPKNSRITIGMKGIVFAPIHMTQRYVHLKGALGEEIEKVINLRGQKKDPLIVKLSSVSIPDKIEVELNEMEKGRSYQLKVKNKVEKETSYGGEVKLTTNYPETPKVWIPVSGHIRPPVEVRPKVVTFGRMSKDRLQQLKKNGRAMRRSVTVLLNNGNDVKIGKVESEKSLFKVVTREVKPGRMVQVSVEPILEKLKKGRNADRLKILTNQRNAELIVVPISFEILQANDDSEVTADGDEDMDGDEADEDELDDDEDDANDD